MEKQNLSNEHKELILEQLKALNDLVLRYVHAEIWPSQNQKLYNGLEDLNKSLKAFEIETEADPWETFHDLRAKLIRNSGTGSNVNGQLGLGGLGKDEVIAIFEQMSKIADDHNFRFDFKKD